MYRYEKAGGVALSDFSDEDAAMTAYRNNAALRAEFTDEAAYLALWRANSRGRVKIMGGRAGLELKPKATVLPKMAADEEAAKSDYARSAALRAEFPDEDEYLAFWRANSQGRIKIKGNLAN